MKFTDSMTLDGGLKRTADGYATFEARVARGGNVQTYLGSELGFEDRETIRVYRPEAEVFKKDAIKTYAGVPVTMGHPQDGVSASNWKDLAVGEVGDDILRDGEFVRVPMILRDASAIAAVEAGQRELSMGYKAELSFQDGVSPSGEAYDAVMTGFQMNHVAAVWKARGGEQLRIGDGVNEWGASPVSIADRKESDMTDIKLRTVVVGDQAVNTTDEGARAIEQLKGQITAKDAKIEADADAHSKAVAAKDAEIDSLKGKLKEAEGKIPAADAISKLVADRVALEAKARAIVADVKADGLTDADLKKAVVAAKVGDEAIKDKAQAYIDARFDILAEDATKDDGAGDPVAAVIKSGITPAVQDAPKLAHDAWAKGVEDLNAWRKEA